MFARTKNIILLVNLLNKKTIVLVVDMVDASTVTDELSKN